ncbi:hypothetical protein BGW36DRAFT_298643 [Talaromyces proteolyticus]|uniref:Uncharacterized protein n=1 Tax=Talaromyces proteolyticus TaxID=1131652 RepID=A0AAD4KM00_9EURO|nr:uncharacterized protein BGW36DRAFT_298643 [Talaromyces proteolyticus]KAH8695688.1 hypothetical protein BGW36DRAFT_298643 [Talaromyces proteolyticus]
MVLSSDISAQKLPELKVICPNKLIDVDEALREDPNLVLEALIKAFLSLQVDEDTLTRIRLGDRFRRSLQAKRQTTPYRLHTIVAECKAGTVDDTSLEAKFFTHGGVRAVTALAAAATDDKQVVKQLKGLPEIQLQSFLMTVDVIKPHPDFLFIVETLDRKKPARLSKRKHIPEPRSRRRLHDGDITGVFPQQSPANSGTKCHQRGHSRNSAISYVGNDNQRSLDDGDTSGMNVFSPSQRNRMTNRPSHAGTCGVPAISTRNSQGHPVVVEPNQSMTNILVSDAATDPILTFAPYSSAQTGRTFPQDNHFPAAMPSISTIWKNGGYDENAEDSDFEHYGIDMDNFTAL